MQKWISISIITTLFMVFSPISALAESKQTNTPATAKSTPKPSVKSTKSTTPSKSATPQVAYTYKQLKADFELWAKKNSIPEILKQVEMQLSEKTKKDTLDFVLKHRNELIKANEDLKIKQQMIDEFYKQMVLVDEFVHMQIKGLFIQEMTTTWLDHITKKLASKKVPRTTQKTWMKLMVKHFVTFKDGVADEMMKGFDISFDPKTIAELSINDIVNALAQKK